MRLKTYRILIVAALLALIALVAGCASATPTPTLVPTARPTAAPSATPTLGAILGPVVPTPTIRPTPQPAQPVEPQGKPVPPVVGEPAYLFSLDDLDGNTHSLADYRGKKVMLNFWASWCGPCQYEIPHMVELYHELEGQGFEIVAVNLREDTDTVAQFVEAQEMEFVILLDTDVAVAQSYFVRAIPTSLFLDEEGNIFAVHTGTLTDEQLRQYVTSLMDS